MARNEFTTGVPRAFRFTPIHLLGPQGSRFGATPSRPAVSCGEENLLCIDGDPYDTENILIHEFAHALHQMAIKMFIPNFKLNWTNASRWPSKKKFGKEPTPRQTRRVLGEGVQSWFDTNRENDHDHGTIDTREELKRTIPNYPSDSEISGYQPMALPKASSAPNHLRT